MSSEKYDITDNSLIERLELLKGNKSQKDFAEWLGESVTTVNGYFTGSSRPKIEFLRSLAIKGVNMNWFFTGVGPVFIQSQTKYDFPPEVQVFVRELMNSGVESEQLPEILKSLNDIVKFQKNICASKEKLSIALNITKQKIKYPKKKRGEL